MTAKRTCCLSRSILNSRESWTTFLLIGHMGRLTGDAWTSCQLRGLLVMMEILVHQCLARNVKRVLQMLRQQRKGERQRRRRRKSQIKSTRPQKSQLPNQVRTMMMTKGRKRHLPKRLLLLKRHLTRKLHLKHHPRTRICLKRSLLAVVRRRRLKRHSKWSKRRRPKRQLKRLPRIRRSRPNLLLRRHQRRRMTASTQRRRRNLSRQRRPNLLPRRHRRRRMMILTQRRRRNPNDRPMVS
mmetsp:Transcript_1234/g.2039  ORF Transcript_1234/g.2039 Transcript_1234/m.2039 type:complete len:240 (-) Transcript_1234:868-1587(-)